MKKKVVSFMVAMLLTTLAVLGKSEPFMAEASECPPHGSYRDQYISSSYPISASHTIYVYNKDTKQYTPETCQYSYQDFTIGIVCNKCNEQVATYSYRTEIHRNTNCPEYE